MDRDTDNGANAGESAAKWALPTHQQRSRQQRDRLLKAGERVFAARGFADAHISEIVGQAGCSIGSFYRRFKDKEALFLALQGDMYDKAHANIVKFFAHPGCDTAPLTRVCFQLIENGAREAAKIKGYYRALFEISLRGVKVWDRMRALERFQAEQLEALFRRRGVTHLRTDFVIAVSATLRMINGNLVSLMLHGPGPYAHGDFRATCELTRILMGVAGLPVEEKVLKRLAENRSGSRG